MGLDISVSFIIERSDATMHPYVSEYDETLKKWIHKPTGEVLPKFEIISSAWCNQLKQLSFVSNFHGSYTSVDKELWDVLGITKELEEEKDNSYSCISPRMELSFETLLEEENKLLNNIREYKKDYMMFKNLLATSNNRESYDLNFENMNGQKELIDYCNEELAIIKDFKAVWNYMMEEDKLKSSFIDNTYIKDKLRVVLLFSF